AIVRAIGAGDAEGPVLARVPARVPVVGPGEYERAGQAQETGRAEVAGQELGLLDLAMTQGVHPQFAQYQRHVAGQVLQPEQVAAKRLAVVQIDVERGDVEERQVQVHRGRVAGVGEPADP